MPLTDRSIHSSIVRAVLVVLSFHDTRRCVGAILRVTSRVPPVPPRSMHAVGLSDSARLSNSSQRGEYIRPSQRAMPLLPSTPPHHPSTSTMPKPRVRIALFRNDLRVHDQPLLHAAVAGSGGGGADVKLLPLYCFDPRQVDLTPLNGRVGQGQFASAQTWHFAFPRCAPFKQRCVRDTSTEGVCY
jgi:hypothetical protein